MSDKPPAAMDDNGSPRKGWLNRQFAKAEQEVATWPAWMQLASGLSEPRICEAHMTKSTAGDDVKSTPTPWTPYYNKRDNLWEARGADGSLAAHFGGGEAIAEADCRCTCTSVNSHASLLAENAKLRDAIKRAGFGLMQTSGHWSIHDVSQLARQDQEKTVEVINQNIELRAAIEAKDAALRKSLETLQCGQHLLLKYCPEHHWMPEHTERIDQLRTALSHAQPASRKET